MNKRMRVAIVLTTLSAALSACGGAAPNDDAVGSDPTTQPTPPATPTTPAAPTTPTVPTTPNTPPANPPSTPPTVPAPLTLSNLPACDTPEAAAAVICGDIKAEDGITPLVGSLLAPVSNPTGSDCKTRTNGAYSCLVQGGSDSSGSIDVAVTREGFEQTNLTVNYFAGQTTENGSTNLVANATQRWLVRTGSFDEVETLLAQLKNCDLTSPTSCNDRGLTVVDEISGQDLSQYSHVFINCDSFSAVLSDADREALRQFIAQGGQLYLSDLASAEMQLLYPNTIEFDTNRGSRGNITATASHPGLSATVGNQVELVFDLSSWSIVSAVPANATVFLEADISSLNGREGKTPITVGFRPQTNSGCVFYTSYHIEGASTGSPQEAALKYLVQNVAQVCQ